jgi:IS30 family transposase
MKYKQLTMMQRYQIEALKKEGLSQRAIANNICVHHSTISRELKRNSLDNDEYNAVNATVSARLRYQYKTKNRRLTKKHTSFIKKCMKDGFSPEQISGRMAIATELRPVSHETIYRYIYHNKRSGGNLYKYLRHKNKKYTKRSASYRSRGQIKNRIPIDFRPAIVEDKLRVGDWEVDTIIGKNHHQAIVTIVDRNSKFTLMKKVEAKQARVVTDAIIHLLKPVQEHTLTITSDNGKEFSYHEEIAETLETDFYFANPYQSWQRGLNEHTNGLIREYFPKKMPFIGITDEQIVEVQNKLNRRPRKILGYKTPAEVFFDTITKSYGAV